VRQRDKQCRWYRGIWPMPVKLPRRTIMRQFWAKTSKNQPFREAGANATGLAEENTTSEFENEA
jgi:hypothetical protein